MIKEYLLTICCTAILCSIINRFISVKGSNGKLIKMISGIFLSLAVVSPFISFRLNDFKLNVDNLQLTADEITEQGVLIGKEERDKIILEQTRTYIISEASRLGTEVDVNVMLSDGDPPVPAQIEIRGNISPYNKTQIKDMIRRQLGVAEENIRWI